MNNLRRRKTVMLAGIGGALLVLIMLAGIFFIAPAIASASSSSGPVATVTYSAPTKSGYCAQYEQDLAKKLNVSFTTLAQDNKAAIIDTINQKVKDGKLTQARANTLIQRVNSKTGNVCPKQLVHKHVWLNTHAQDVINQLAQGLHLNASQLQAQFKAGNGLPEIAKVQNVSTSSLQTLVQNTATTILKKAVSAGNLTQARADVLTKVIQNHPMTLQKWEAAIVKRASAK